MLVEVKGDMPLGRTLQTQGINLFDDFSRILVHDQLVLILWVFDITVGASGVGYLDGSWETDQTCPVCDEDVIVECH